jgi:ketosteroid isomerase-like protein
VTGITDSDQGASADPAGNGRGTIRREQAPDLPVGQRVTARDVEMVRRAFTALAAGDPNPAVQALDPRVRWQAVASRSLANGVTLDRRGADLYLRQMARSIASGERRLELISIVSEGDRVVTQSRWVESGKEESAAECANTWSLVGGVVMIVVEVATSVNTIPPDIAR